MIKYCFFYVAVASAAIVDIQSISEIAPPEQGTLIAFDVDDTLICYPSHLGCELWFKEALDDPHFHEWTALLADNLPVIPVEGGTPGYIANLQEHHTVVAITARFPEHPAYPNWSQKTEEQIRSIGVHLDLYMVGDGSKGEKLHELAKQHGASSIVLIDDRLSDLEEANTVLSREGVPFTGYCYHAIEKSRSAYDSTAAWAELETISTSKGEEELLR